jgi:choline dehydrogenase
MSKTPKKSNKNVASPSRRSFLKTSAGVTAAALVPGVVLKSGSARAETASGNPDSFEYIVIGSGAGGGPVAANLAKAGYRVLLLEAGGQEEPQEYSVPAFQGLSTEQPDLAWHFYVDHYTDQVRQAQDSKYVPGKGVLYPRAGTLGGCTAHNAMITMYPDNSDWDNIASLTGDRSWNSTDMRTYFQRVENASYIHASKGNIDRRGFDGWLNTEQTALTLLKKDGKLAAFVAAAAAATGLKAEVVTEIMNEDLRLKLDPNNWRYVNNKRAGLFNVPKATKNGRRNGTRELLLKTKREHPDKLEIRTHALASKILLDGPENRAVGVEYLEGTKLYQADPRSTEASRSSGVRRQVFATREVICSGGAFNTPQLLMLSGIGPDEVLRSKGIDQKVRLNGVGRNLQDRYEVGVVTQLDSDLDLTKACTWGAEGDPCLDDYKKDPTHSLYGSNGVVVGMIRRSSPEKHDPDLFIFGVPGKFKGYFPGWSRDSIQKDFFTWAVLKGHTQNTAGFVSLKTDKPTDTPYINFKYFDEGNDAFGDDLKSITEGVKFARKVNSHLQRVIKTEMLPSIDVKTDEDIQGFIKKEAWGHHASCSCKMGPASDPDAVVDSNFKVNGTQGLRIVDASVFPKIPGLFIVAPTYMIAEKASAVLIADAAKKS